jgi:hypothetical protein
MAKRTRQKAASGGNSKHPPKKKTATPDNPAPKEKSAISVNPAYDAMPDTVEDPAAVFKLAFLDMQEAKYVAELAVIAQEYDRRLVALKSEKQVNVGNAKSRLKEAQRKLKEHRDHIEATYGLALRSYTYDDETGILKKQELPDEEVDDKGATQTATGTEKTGNEKIEGGSTGTSADPKTLH